MAEGTSTLGRKLLTTSLGLVAVAVLALGAAYWNASAGRGVFCTAAGSSGPVADTPEGALDAWWDQVYPNGPTRSEVDLTRENRTTWHVDKGGPEWRKIEVDHADRGFLSAEEVARNPDGWTVVAANSCHEA